MALLRTYLAAILSAALVLAAFGGASARMMRSATGQMVICTGTGPAVIYVDDAGQPAKPPHPCPDCISLTLETGLVPSCSAPADALQVGHWADGGARMAPVLLPAAPKARAPPSRV
jgi:hypothetical protein